MNAQADHITLEELYRDHPRWHAWRDTSGLWYAAVRDDQQMTTDRGDDHADLWDEIQRSGAVRAR